jgi:hypothetical protein
VHNKIIISTNTFFIIVFKAQLEDKHGSAITIKEKFKGIW